MSSRISLACLYALLLCACTQTVSNPNKSEENNDQENTQSSLPTDSTGDITAATLKTVTVSDDGSTEAKYFFDGQEKINFLNQYKLHGDNNLKETQLKEMNDSLEKGQQLFDNAAKSDKWFVPATIQKGSLYFAMANSIKKQESNATSKLDSIAKALSTFLEQLPYYEQARSIFQQGIDAVRSKKISDPNTGILEEYYIYTFYEDCNTYREISFLYRDHPLPDSAAVAQEYIQHMSTTEEDAKEMTHEDLEAYREELSSKSKEMKGKAISVCTSGVQEAQKYDLKNVQVEAIKGLLRLLDPGSLALQ